MRRFGRRSRLVVIAVAMVLAVGCTPGGGGRDGGGPTGAPAAPGASPSSGGYRY